MATLWQILTPENKVKLASLYQELAGFEFIPPESSRPPVKYETKLESIEEIDKIMRQKPERII